MNSKEYKELIDAYCSVYEQVKVPENATDAEALKGLIPKGEKVHEVPKKKPSLQNASYQPEGELVDEGLGKALLAGAGALAALAAAGQAMKPSSASKPRPGTIESNIKKRRAAESELMRQSYDLEGEEYLDEAPIASRNYGDPVAANWNRGYASYRTAQSQGREMTPPSIPSGYRWNQQAGTITRGGAAPQTTNVAKPAPSASQSFQSSGGYGRYPVPTTPNARKDPEFRRGPSGGAGNMNAGRSPAAAAPTRPARPAAAAPTRPARPAAAAPTRPATPLYSGATGVRPVGTPLSTNAVRPVANAPAQNAPVSAPQRPANKLMQGMPSVSSTAAPAGGPTLSARSQALKAGGPQGGARARVLNQDLDLFDIIKGHLLDEGYADTEESAYVIMANMSEEWRQSILSEDPVQDFRDRERAKQNSAGMRGPELSHSSKGTPKPGSATVTRQPRSREFSHGGLTPKGREFTNPPS